MITESRFVRGAATLRSWHDRTKGRTVTTGLAQRAANSFLACPPPYELQSFGHVMSIRARHLSRIGQSHLQEAILDVLFHAYSEPDGLKPDEISKRAGIHRGTIHRGNQNHIVAGLLAPLQKQGMVKSVQKYTVNRVWRLTESEYKSRLQATRS